MGGSERLARGNDLRVTREAVPRVRGANPAPAGENRGFGGCRRGPGRGPHFPPWKSRPTKPSGNRWDKTVGSGPIGDPQSRDAREQRLPLCSPW